MLRLARSTWTGLREIDAARDDLYLFVDGDPVTYEIVNPDAHLVCYDVKPSGAEGAVVRSRR